MAPVVQLSSAVALLGRFPALAGVDLTVDAGEVVLLQGPNGAGKTTLLRVCAGLVPVVEGTAVVLGSDLVVDPTTVRRRVGYLGHGSGLYPDLTIAENLRVWTRAAGIDLGRADGRADSELTEVTVRLGLDGRLKDLAVARLSEGQRKRAALAVLVLRRPELWLLDEPHAGLDRAGRDLTDQLIGDAAAAGATVIMSSHELDRARSVARRMVTVAGGVITNDTISPDMISPDPISLVANDPSAPAATDPTGPGVSDG
ncbi:MAG: heme ABC exporter ATP-binding protein CcmA [Candidatus Microthrix parvicella]